MEMKQKIKKAEEKVIECELKLGQAKENLNLILLDYIQKKNETQ